MAVVADGETPAAGLSQAMNVKRTGSRRAVAAKKKLNTDPDMPSFKAAMSGDDSTKWYEACQEEYTALRDHGTFSLVPRPVDKPVVSAKFVLKIKRGPDGSVDRYKARYVARGFTQVEGVDFFRDLLSRGYLCNSQSVTGHSGTLRPRNKAHIYSVHISKWQAKGRLVC